MSNALWLDGWETLDMKIVGDARECTSQLPIRSNSQQATKSAHLAMSCWAFIGNYIFDIRAAHALSDAGGRDV